MQQAILVLHLLIAIALVALVLMQRSEGGGLGMGGGVGNVFSVRGQANLLTRVTGGLAAAFMATSILLAILAGQSSGPGTIVEEQPAATGTTAPAAAPDVPAATPAVPTGD